MENKRKYIIVGDDNYWYATTQEAVTKEQLATIVDETFEMIKKGGQFAPTPSSSPNELYAYPVSEPIEFRIED